MPPGDLARDLGRPRPMESPVMKKLPLNGDTERPMARFLVLRVTKIERNGPDMAECHAYLSRILDSTWV